jgi:PTH1 family peptidyl-tRNA hydrolase
MPEIKLIVGLGNPGAKYVNTRHNVGFQAVDCLAAAGELAWKNWAGMAEVAGSTGGKILLVKPQTYMNNSGAAVKSISGYFHVVPEEILVIVDDFSLPLGALRPRRSGSAGGHNGLASIADHLGTLTFPRFRLGIGPVPPHIDPADFVLGTFRADERTAVRRMFDGAAVFIELMLSEGWDKAVSKLPGKMMTE